jgi:hypothetical protein
MLKSGKPFTVRYVHESLVKIAKIGGGSRSSMICSDLIDQEQLYELQEKLQALMEEVALHTTGGQAELMKEFPFIWKPAKAKAGGVT